MKEKQVEEGKQQCTKLQQQTIRAHTKQQSITRKAGKQQQPEQGSKQQSTGRWISNAIEQVVLHYPM
jgi:hypothetical protein